MEAAKSTLESKLLQLQLTKGRTGEIMQGGMVTRVQRQIKTLKELTEEADGLRRSIEATKIAAKEEIAEIKTWSDDIEAKIMEADDDISRLSKFVEELNKRDNQKLREEELDHEKRLFETRLHYQTQLEAKKSSEAQQDKLASSMSTVLEAKLPK